MRCHLVAVHKMYLRHDQQDRELFFNGYTELDSDILTISPKSLSEQARMNDASRVWVFFLERDWNKREENDTHTQRVRQSECTD